MRVQVRLRREWVRVTRAEEALLDLEADDISYVRFDVEELISELDGEEEKLGVDWFKVPSSGATYCESARVTDVVEVPDAVSPTAPTASALMDALEDCRTCYGDEEVSLLERALSASRTNIS